MNRNEQDDLVNAMRCDIACLGDKEQPTAGSLHIGISQRCTMRPHAPGREVATSDTCTHTSVFANNATGALLASFLKSRVALPNNITTSNGNPGERAVKSWVKRADLLDYYSEWNARKKARVGVVGLITILVLLMIALQRHNSPVPPGTSVYLDNTKQTNSQQTTPPQAD